MPKQCKILIGDRNYTTWFFNDIDANIDIKLGENEELSKIQPLEQKMFSGDVIAPDGTIIYSFVKNCPNLAAVLLLEKTYGRTPNKKRLLYKCIPNDRRLPFFLVPYDIKMGFQKNIVNKYITFRYDHWDQQHPHGIIQEVLGDVNNMEAYYEYQLYCRSLHESMRDFTKKSRYLKNNEEHIQKIISNTNFVIETRIDEYIFSIDSLNSTDLDDAFGFRQLDENNYCMSVYISNVFFWMETFDLWSSFSQRVATIYLPNYKRPLLPTILSSDLCSLLQDQLRFAFVMDIYVNSSGEIGRCEFKNALIKVKKNYCYEDPKMVAKDTYYRKFLEITQKINPAVNDSHDLVTYWMIHLNKRCGKYMLDEKIGIFRSTIHYHSPNNKLDENTMNYDHLNEDTKRVITNWNNLSGRYMLYNEDGLLSHEIMETTGYIHITSPIRRLVDLLNQLLFLRRNKMIMNLSKSGEEFMNQWLEKMEYINTSMRSIRKIQTDCEIMQRCFDNPQIINNVYEGVVFDKIAKNDGLITYMVYLEKLKLLSRITTSIDVPNLSKESFKLFLFEDEYSIRKKIRLQIVS
jgi:exoribonuclease R